MTSDASSLCNLECFHLSLSLLDVVMLLDPYSIPKKFKSQKYQRTRSRGNSRMTPKHRSTGACQLKKPATIEAEDLCSNWIALSPGGYDSEPSDDDFDLLELEQTRPDSPICVQEPVIVPARVCGEKWANPVSTGMYKIYCTSSDRPWRVDAGRVKADGRGSDQMERIATTDTRSSETFYSFKHGGKYVTAVLSRVHYRLVLRAESASAPEMRRFRTVYDENAGKSGYLLVPEFSSGLAVKIGMRGGLKLISRRRQRDMSHWDFQ